MALRAVPDHPKFQHLMALSGLPKYEVLGLLEALWHFTGRFTPQGNIGKYPDAQIAAWIGWTGQALDLISLLITCGWIEEDDTHRLIVHDWNEHADRATRATLARHKCSFVLHTCNTHDTLPVPVPVPEPVIISKRNTSSHPKPPKSAVGECADDSVSNSKKETNALQARFDLFWAAYPRRTAKGEAVKSWFKIKPSDELAGRILDSVEAHKTCEQWLKSNGQFIPHPATWLNQRRWEDEPETVGVAGREDRGSNNPAFLELEKRTPEEIARLDRIRAEMEADMARRAAGLPNPNGEAEYEHRF